MTACRILIVGHGRMGRLVESLAPSYACEVAGIVERASGAGAFDVPADVAIDFSVGSAVPATVSRLAAARIPVVIGTTGWQAQEAEIRRMAAAAGIGVLVSANFAIGMTIFRQAVATAAALAARQADVGAWIHEAHHATKQDAPSGTALLLERAMTSAGYDRPIAVSSTRAGSLPGTHTVGFDSPAETLTFTHVVRDRSVFARGALEAARWLAGRSGPGWFTLGDTMGIGNLESAIGNLGVGNR